MARNRIALPILVVVIAAAVAVIATTGGGSKKSSQPVSAKGTTISVKQTAAGKVLVDGKGRTLYLFLADKPNVSRLSAAGQGVWPLFTSTATPGATGGASAAQLGTIPATGQVTYNGHPLYYFVGDHQPGQVAGQGLNEFGARWYAVSASGNAITSAASSGAASPSGASSSGSSGSGGGGGGGGSYGY